jgi:hypothetical protein
MNTEIPKPYSLFLARLKSLEIFFLSSAYEYDSIINTHSRLKLRCDDLRST